MFFEVGVPVLSLIAAITICAVVTTVATFVDRDGFYDDETESGSTSYHVLLILLCGFGSMSLLFGAAFWYFVRLSRSSRWAFYQSLEEAFHDKFEPHAHTLVGSVISGVGVDHSHLGGVHTNHSHAMLLESPQSCIDIEKKGRSIAVALDSAEKGDFHGMVLSPLSHSCANEDHQTQSQSSSISSRGSRSASPDKSVLGNFISILKRVYRPLCLLVGSALFATSTLSYRWCTLMVCAISLTGMVVNVVRKLNENSLWSLDEHRSN